MSAVEPVSSQAGLASIRPGAIAPLFEVERHDYRVLIEGPHVGLTGCGKVWFFDTLGDAEAAIETAPTLCDAGVYPVHGECDGSCPVDVLIERIVRDPYAPPGERLLRVEVVATVKRTAVAS